MNTAAIASTGYQTLPIANIHESTTNPRRTFDEAKLMELAESIRVHGLIQPITVRPNRKGFEIIAGARRFRAALLAEQTELQAIVRDLTDAQALEVQIIENAQRQDVHPYEEAAGYQRLLELPGYDVAALAVKCGKSQSHIYSRLSLLQLTSEVAEAFQQDRITATHANLLARLPADEQPEAFKACWRTDYRDNNDAHLLPAKYLASWIDANVYIELNDAPFPLDDATLNEEAGACHSCPYRTGFNSLLFSDSNSDMCLKATCYNSKVAAHVSRVVSSRPELVQIATDWRREDDPAVLTRSDYNPINRNKGKDGQPQRCEHTHEAIIAFGEGVGTLTSVCTGKDCAIHGNPRIAALTPEEIAAQKLRIKEEKARVKKTAERRETFAKIMSNVPARPSSTQLRFLLRALVYSSGYNLFEDVAVYFTELSSERNEQSDEEVLDGVITRSEAAELPAVLARLALTDHIDIPRDEQIDFLSLAVAVFPPPDKPAAIPRNKTTAAKVAKPTATKRKA